MIWLDLDAKSALDTGTPSVEAHKCAVIIFLLMTQVLDIFHSPPMDPPPWVDYGLTQNFRHEIEKNDRIIKTLVELTGSLW